MAWRRLIRHLVSAPAAGAAAADPGAVAAMAERLRSAGMRRLGRSLAILHVAAGSCGGCELELRATGNLIHDLGQYGLSFAASPRHADVLLITGVAGRNMLEAVREARAAMPDPVFVIALGDCAVDGGVFKGAAANSGGADRILPVDLMIPGCPPDPARIIEALLAVLAAHDGV
jgi:Ni,Fe-hydrogenase III small subunit